MLKTLNAIYIENITDPYCKANPIKQALSIFLKIVPLAVS